MRALLLCVLFVIGGCVPQPVVPAPLDGAEVTRSDGQPSDAASMLRAAAEAAVVCVGEQHDEPAHHVAQHAFVEYLADESERDERSMALGLEMFRRHHQAALDHYGSGHLTSEDLARATNWKHDWGFEYEMYEPLLRTAAARGVQLIALNAPRELSRAIARGGIASLASDVRASLPDLDLGSDAHRRFFWVNMGFDHGGAHGSGHGGQAEQLYAAQVLWDETMASGVAAWLAEPARRILVIAGNGHCHDSAIPERVRRRRPQTNTLSILLSGPNGELPAQVTSDFVVRLKGASVDQRRVEGRSAPAHHRR